MHKLNKTTEIERKFLVTSDSWVAHCHEKQEIVQGYLPTNNGAKGARVRVLGEQGFLTLKGKQVGISRPELEAEIPLELAKSLLGSSATVVHKTRHLVQHGDHLWEIDVFHGRNAGLVLAEVELQHESEVVDIPSWAGADVSTVKKYSSRSLAYPAVINPLD